MKKNVLSTLALLATTVLVCGATPKSKEPLMLNAEKMVAVKAVEEPVYEAVPESFKEEIDHAGTLEELFYSTDVSGESIEKNAFVYLPYGYDSSKKYDILYLMHGAGGNSSAFLGDTNTPTDLKYVIDNMIDQKLIDPVIVVAPTNSNYEIDQLGTFAQEEIRSDLLPAVEGKYSTYAESTSAEDLIKSRKHRAFGGFSLGATTTWYVLQENLAYFHDIIPLSGDSWIVQTMGGQEYAQETAELVAGKIKDQGYSTEDYFIFAATGTEDIAYRGLSNQVEEMKKLENDFIFDYDEAKGNFYFILSEGGQHSYEFITDYLYDILPFFYGK